MDRRRTDRNLWHSRATRLNHAVHPGRQEAPLPHIVSVQIGKIGRLGPRRVPSAFLKTPVPGPTEVTLRGLAGDEQADVTVHGDPAKAIYGYPDAAYDIWRASHPQHDALLHPGGMAENLTIAGLMEEDVCIGDVMQAGTALLQVTQPREPCYKFALFFNDSGMPKAMIRNGRSGWYYRVLTAGHIAANDPVTLTDRPNPAWPIPRMNAFIHAKSRPPAEARELAALPGLAETWPARLLRVK